MAMSDLTDDYVAHMAEVHERFTAATTDLLASYREAQIGFTTLLRNVDRRLTDLHERQAELQRLILEHGAEVRALRDRLTGNGNAGR